ncbi:DUF389 domain-containing protein [Marilutibacter chinensis]|uniref:DUF389 domain-containing protein n=1 Tax=Marilutibacter chinensis TaxID=2912247 RepID=A0ABS9HZM7_9GAMM|nr:DUF389 domain-containing protein [Lysobacter chinensis]MCF7223637.1 DUF389 domain-containing protein [Lysobacter chinensis]
MPSLPRIGARWRWLRRWRARHLDVDRHAVVEHVCEAGALAPRYVFMTVMSCGIATLGLLLGSAAVIIGAMLISPLMGPIVSMGMSLATFDFRALRSALKAIGVGVAVSLLTAMAIVLVSPLREPTEEILARTEPTLFDLLVAVFSGLAGAYATITRKGETIVGVAIATALMPPLAVVGFGTAIGNGTIAGGAAFLFMTNLLAIALSVTIMARWYGFGATDSPKQTAWQAALIVGTFVLLSIPLGLALREIAARGAVERTVRTTLDTAAREIGGRVTTLRVDRDDRTLLVDAVLMTPTYRPQLAGELERTLESAIGQPVVVKLSEVLTADVDAQAREQASASLAQLRDSVQRLQSAAHADAETRTAGERALAELRERAIGHFGRFEVLQGGGEATWQLRPEAGLDLHASRQLEIALHDGGARPRVRIVPALQPLPLIGFGDDSATLDDDATGSVQDIAWALERWQLETVEVTGYAGGDQALATARAEAVATALREAGIDVAAVAAADRDEARSLIAREGSAAIRAARVQAVTN